jgi:hypothetical protein
LLEGGKDVVAHTLLEDNVVVLAGGIGSDAHGARGRLGDGRCDRGRIASPGRNHYRWRIIRGSQHDDRSGAGQDVSGVVATVGTLGHVSHGAMVAPLEPFVEASAVGTVELCGCYPDPGKSPIPCHGG